MELAHSQISEFFRITQAAARGVPFSLSLIMNSLMRHERVSFVSGNGHEQCNGFEFSLRIPRSRSGNFYPVLSGLIRSESEERARLVQSSLHQRSYRRADR